MSRGIQAKYKLLEIKDGAAYYAYGGSNFSYPYDKTIYNSLDGRIKIVLSALKELKDSELKNIESALDRHDIELLTPCFYAEENMYGFDIFALKTIVKIIATYNQEQKLPEDGMWVC